MVCICAPATDSEAPTVTAISAMGMRMSQITTRSWSLTVLDWNRALSTSESV